jgi:hypothetical protein
MFLLNHIERARQQRQEDEVAHIGTVKLSDAAFQKLESDGVEKDGKLLLRVGNNRLRLGTRLKLRASGGCKSKTGLLGLSSAHGGPWLPRLWIESGDGFGPEFCCLEVGVSELRPLPMLMLDSRQDCSIP